MIIDCNTCELEATTACDECIVPVLLNQMSGPFDLGKDEAAALDNLADAGLVTPLRLVSDHGTSATG
ncbi:MAG: hypothetical protein GY722_17410 [bacterium]|nr:hypothetical protein [bacterium]